VIAARPHRSGNYKDAHVRGWLVSVLLHGTVALAAILIVKQIQLSPQNEPFKWKVAMVMPAQPVTPPASPTYQAPPPTVRSTTPAPSPPVQQTSPAQTPPSPQPLTQQSAPSISERIVAPVVTESPAPTPPQPTAPPQSVAHTTQPVEPVRHETVAPMTTSGVKQVEAPMAASAESAAKTAPSSAPSAILAQTTQSEIAPAPTQMAAIPPAPSNAPTKRDYGWLSEAILRRVEELKHYPPSARVDRAEGKVVVKAVINEDGSIGEVEVFQSSGHPGLDKAAVETMRQAAPFHLPRPLGQPRMTIKIPMSYRLDP
jgi:periplasmic protein TonB